MLGAIAGDIIGSRFEFDEYKHKDFDLFGHDGLKKQPCEYTDDTVMTVAVAAALLKYKSVRDDDAFKNDLIGIMHEIGNLHIDAGYGTNFYYWLKDRSFEPYHSFGNGSAMRVSPVGWFSRSLREAEHIGKLTAEVTHDHPEGIRGAQAVAAAIWLGRNGKNKEEIREYIGRNYYPEVFTLTVDALRPDYEFDETCQGTVPAAFAALFEADSYEDAVRNAVSLGGDSDTLANITGGMAEALYGLPGDVAGAAITFLDGELREFTNEFIGKYCREKKADAIIELNSDTLWYFKNDDILAYSMASAGACGEGGSVRYLGKGGLKYHLDRLSEEMRDVDAKRYLPHLTEKGGWFAAYMGLGNYLYFRAEDSDWMDTHLDMDAGAPFQSLYRNWERYYLERLEKEEEAYGN